MGSKVFPNETYTVKGHMAHSGFKFNIKGCCVIDDIWYRPVVADYSGNSKSYRQPEEDEIGWDIIPFADDAIIDSWEKEWLDEENLSSWSFNDRSQYDIYKANKSSSNPISRSNSGT